MSPVIPSLVTPDLIVSECSRGERGKAEPTLAGAEETALLNSPLRTYHSVIQPAPSPHIPESVVASEVA